MKHDEHDLLHMFIERVPFELPDVRVFRRNIVNLPSTVDGRTFRVRNGIAGQADAYAVVKGGGHIEIETKAAHGTMKTAQKMWRAWCNEWGIPHLVCREKPKEPPEKTVARWVEMLRGVVA